MRTVLALCLMLSAPCADAAEQSGDWPCVQRKVPEISMAAIWQGPPLKGRPANWREDGMVADLAQLLAARRTEFKDAEKAIAAFVSSAGARPDERLLTALTGLVELVNTERASVIAGLERYGAAQKDLAELVRKENAALSDLRQDATADPALVAQKAEQLNWNLRIFQERQRSLRFVCEVPVLIEQRLFALAKAIQKAAAR
jgi:hypothetical protein